MTNRMRKKRAKKEEAVRAIITEAMDTKFRSILDDIEYRLNCIADEKLGTGRINSRHLNLATPILDGFSFADNSPSAGSVAWTGCNIMYRGTNYAITDGNTTKKYIWWQKSASPNTAFQTSDTFPSMTDDDVLIALNVGGSHQMNIGDGRATNGLAINPESITGTQIGSGAIGTSNIAAQAITNTLLASGAVKSGNIASGAVTSGALAGGAVRSSAIAAGAVGGTQIASGAVSSTQLASGAVTSGKLASSAVTSEAIAPKAVTSSAIADSAVGSTQLTAGAVTAAKIAAGAVGSAQIGSGAIQGSNIGAGAVASSNLNLAQHMLY